MPVDVCTAALQGVQGVLPFVSPARRATLLAAVCTLSHRSAARSAVKAACLTFQQALLAQGGQVLYPDPMTGVTLLPEAVLIEWLQVRHNHNADFPALVLLLPCGACLTILYAWSEAAHRCHKDVTHSLDAVT